MMILMILYIYSFQAMFKNYKIMRQELNLTLFAIIKKSAAFRSIELKLTLVRMFSIVSSLNHIHLYDFPCA